MDLVPLDPDRKQRFNFLQARVDRGAHVDDVDARDIDNLAWAINSTPRKCLNFKTPAETFLENLNRCT